MEGLGVSFRCHLGYGVSICDLLPVSHAGNLLELFDRLHNGNGLRQRIWKLNAQNRSFIVFAYCAL